MACSIQSDREFVNAISSKQTCATKFKTHLLERSGPAAVGTPDGTIGLSLPVEEPRVQSRHWP
jgi:hypothetical protein